MMRRQKQTSSGGAAPTTARETTSTTVNQYPSEFVKLPTIRGQMIKYPNNYCGPRRGLVQNVPELDLCYGVDVSGSMTCGGFNYKVKAALQDLLRSNGTHAQGVLYGSSDDNPHVGYVPNHNHSDFVRVEIPNSRVITTLEQLNQELHFGGGTYSRKLRYIPRDGNIIILIGDGALSDPVVWNQILSDKIAAGDFQKATHFVFVFAPHTQPRDKMSLYDNLVQMTRSSGIACEIIIKDTITHSSMLTELVAEIKSNYSSFTELPPGYLRISNLVAFHELMLPDVFGKYLLEHKPALLHVILEKVKQMARTDPQALVDDPVWAKVHKALIVAFAEQPYLYKDWMAETKRSFPRGDPRRDALEKLYKESFKNNAWVLKTMSEIPDDLIIGFLVANPDSIDEDEIIAAVRAKVTICNPVAKVRKSMRFLSRVAGEEINPQDLPGMPILDTRKASPAQCREMFKLFFIQWTTTPLSVMLQWIAAMFLLTKEGRPLEKEIVDMIQKSFFDAERHNLDMLGITPAGIDPDKRSLLFFVPITMMLAEVLQEHKEKMFPITLGGSPGESLVSRKDLMKHITTWIKVSRRQTFVLCISYNDSYNLQRPIQKVIKQGTGSGFATELSPGDVVQFSPWAGEPWTNLPAIGVVVVCQQIHSRKKKKRCKIVIQQLDDGEYDGEMFRRTECHRDVRQYTTGDIHKLGLTVLASIPVDKEGLHIQGAVEPHRQKVLEINGYLMGLKYGGDARFHRDAPIASGVRLGLLNHIKTILGTMKAETIEIMVPAPVPLEVMLSLLPIPTGMGGLIRAKANPSMEQMLDLLENPIQSPADQVRRFSFKYDGRKYDAIITDEEIAEIIEHYDRLFQSHNKTSGGLEVLDVVECSVCFDAMNYRHFKRLPCSHYLCHDCWDGVTKEYIPGAGAPAAGVDLESVILDMNCMCPECRAPFEHPDGRINDLYAQHPHGLPPATVFRFCEECYDLFEQDAPACGNGMEFTETKCEECRPPPPGTRQCPGCGIHTEKSSGCDHITCPCGEHWCWKCGEGEFDGGTIYDHIWDCEGDGE